MECSQPLFLGVHVDPQLFSGVAPRIGMGCSSGSPTASGPRQAHDEGTKGWSSGLQPGRSCSSPTFVPNIFVPNMFVPNFPVGSRQEQVMGRYNDSSTALGSRRAHAEDTKGWSSRLKTATIWSCRARRVCF